jgi:hypothetical protein
MRRIFLALALSFVFLGVGLNAQQKAEQNPGVDTTGLSADQIKVLSAAAQELKKQPANTIANFTLANATPDRIKEWGDAGIAAGKAVVGFTQQVGIAADQFLKTDVGRTGFYVLVWKFGGDKVATSLMNVLLDVALAILLYTFWWKLTRRFVFNERKEKTVSYHQNTLLRWLGFNKKDIAWKKDNEWMANWSSDEQFWIMFWSRVISGALFVAITLICWPSVSF